MSATLPHIDIFRKENSEGILLTTLFNPPRFTRVACKILTVLYELHYIADVPRFQDKI